ncbi:uncharacterized protein TA13705 [Theileria annulata]|uniref:Uncharacterized protein n=1 Tax=Theileria annulata TaxID=5874 RepID=Q4UEN8_THEAN|nr:uncharacterized protein TA13705 [Theileria annulata]CAI74451.1 hypothetical protein TA13705 [Theileria annulata]|eukprot:XP_952183.1 hypothetical protein TA13705 [Theileria annulata]
MNCYRKDERFDFISNDNEYKCEEKEGCLKEPKEVIDKRFKPDRCVCLDIYHREIGPDNYEQYKENETLVTKFKQDCAKIKYEGYVLFDVLLTPGFGLVNQMIFNGSDSKIELISGSDKIVINAIGAQLTLSRPGTNGSLIPLRPASYEMVKCEGDRSLTTLTGKEICTHVALNGVPKWRGTVDGPKLISILNDQVNPMLILRFPKCFLLITLQDETFSYTIPIPPIRAFYDFNGQETVIPDEVIELKVSDKNNISFTFDKKITIKKVKLSNFKLLSDESDGFKIKSVEYHDIEKKLIYRTEKEAITHFLTEGHKNLITRLSERESAVVLDGVIIS